MRNRRLLFTAALMLAVLLASCSVVFEAGISGTVETPSGTGKTAVAGVNVFAYTNESSRTRCARRDSRVPCDGLSG